MSRWHQGFTGMAGFTSMAGFIRTALPAAPGGLEG